MLKNNYTMVRSFSPLMDTWFYVDRKEKPQGEYLLRANNIGYYYTTEFVSQTTDYKFVIIKTFKWKRKQVMEVFDKLHKKMSLIEGMSYLNFLEDVEAKYSEMKGGK